MRRSKLWISPTICLMSLLKLIFGLLSVEATELFGVLDRLVLLLATKLLTEVDDCVGLTLALLDAGGVDVPPPPQPPKIRV